MKDKIITYSFILVIEGFFLLNLWIPDQKISFSERRDYQTFPQLTWDSIHSKDWMNDFDRYTLDQFAFRDSFRSLKAHVVFDVFHNLDNNKIFVKDDIIFKSEYPINEGSIQRFIQKMNTLKNKYLKNNKVYYSIIPDKNYYLKDSTHLNLDYGQLYDMVINGLQDMEFIDLRDTLSLNDYYRTDTHWRQERLLPVAQKLGNQMGFAINTSYQERKYAPFYGVYYGQSALKLPPDELIYLENEELKQAIVTSYEGDNLLYNTSKLGSMDSYDVFLSGATPFITIENPSKTNEKELIIFRDSFGSSLTPLLISAYSKITLVDLRYMNTKVMEEFITFENQDVLILYSTLLVNNSVSIRD